MATQEKVGSLDKGFRHQFFNVVLLFRCSCRNINQRGGLRTALCSGTSVHICRMLRVIFVAVFQDVLWFWQWTHSWCQLCFPPQNLAAQESSISSGLGVHRDWCDKHICVFGASKYPAGMDRACPKDLAV